MPELFVITGSNGAGKSTVGPAYFPEHLQEVLMETSFTFLESLIYGGLESVYKKNSIGRLRSLSKLRLSIWSTARLVVSAISPTKVIFRRMKVGVYCINLKTTSIHYILSFLV